MLPEWVGWLFGGVSAVYAAWLTAYLSAKFTAQKEKEANWEARLTALERSQVDMNRWLTEIEKQRAAIEAEKITRLSNIEAKLDRFSERISSTRWTSSPSHD